MTITLENMTIDEKIELMEILWDDISHGSKEYVSPAWHGEILTERKTSIVNGTASYSDFDAAKDRLRNLKK